MFTPQSAPRGYGCRLILAVRASCYGRQDITVSPLKTTTPAAFLGRGRNSIDVKSLTKFSHHRQVVS